MAFYVDLLLDVIIISFQLTLQWTIHNHINYPKFYSILFSLPDMDMNKTLSGIKIAADQVHICTVQNATLRNARSESESMDQSPSRQHPKGCIAS
jgi:hypothetical protein